MPRARFHPLKLSRARKVGGALGYAMIHATQCCRDHLEDAAATPISLLRWCGRAWISILLDPRNKREPSTIGIAIPLADFYEGLDRQARADVDDA